MRDWLATLLQVSFAAKQYEGDTKQTLRVWKPLLDEVYSRDGKKPTEHASDALLKWVYQMHEFELSEDEINALGLPSKNDEMGSSLIETKLDDTVLAHCFSFLRIKDVCTSIERTSHRFLQVSRNHMNPCKQPPKQQALTFEQVQFWLSENSMTGAGLWSRSRSCWVSSVLVRSDMKRKVLSFILEKGRPRRLDVSQWPSDCIILNSDRFSVTDPSEIWMSDGDIKKSGNLKEEQMIEKDTEWGPHFWALRPDYSSMEEIGYLTDQGFVINGWVNICQPEKLFLYVWNDFQSYTAGVKYFWIPLPSARIGPIATQLPFSYQTEYIAGQRVQVKENFFR